MNIVDRKPSTVKKSGMFRTKTLSLRATLMCGLFAALFLVTAACTNESASAEASDAPEADAVSVPEVPTPGQYAVTSAHHLATEAGLEVLEAGGTAADAAVAVAGALSVVEPYFSSVLGGGTWALYYDAETGEVTSLDGVGVTGSRLDVDHYAERAGDFGAHQAIVPGAWDGWMLWLREYGRLDLGDVLAPAIRLAEDGFTVTPSTASRFRIRSQNMDMWPDTAATYLRDDGSVPEEGDTVRIPDMARTFRDLVAAYDEGLSGGRVTAIQAARDHFYRGPYAQAIVEFTEELDGYLTIEDFHGYEAQIVEPISIDYNGVEVFQNPPNSQGITQLLALNILKDYDLSQYEMDSADAVHLQVEAIKLAFADRYYHVGDPDFVEVPVAELLSDDYASSQRQRISMDTVLEWPLENQLAADRLSAVVDMHPDDGNTTTYHILDAEGNAAAVTTSLGFQLMVVGDTGIHLNNRMRMFSIDPSEPNYMEPGKKVRHTSNPYMALLDGRPYILGGNTGNDMQSQGQVQQFVAVVDFGATAQEAVDRYRFESRAFPQGIPPYAVYNDLRFEDGFDEDVIRELESRGHTIGEGILAGSAAMIVIDPETGAVETGAETRGDGSGVVR